MSPSPYAVRVSAPAAKVLDALPEHAADTVSDILAAAAAADPFGFGPRYLWPGRPASRPIGGGWALTRLKRHGLLSLSARNTAMIEFVAELPPIGVSERFQRCH
ncbi:hypothetical protein B591_31218 (plasmid) [Streptomyces sp. GBA 94-10 4N24]|uniref:hypothetical protein n=1 Tax=Streptomyces sp. GBA 94-10 4N24 TaxID=1218177 RepID=UPI0003C2F8EA|nr:hypothetical protein [Streptomyces sp. GBA 94-10 4N24]ESP95763.1 hypothetical protein B591_31218 [Streptomyces sp. GBA 94-10 4N24]UZN63223.1 hypothetical protein B591N_31218 [Streptomyces sp. GBA 94-10 4N24]